MQYSATFEIRMLVPECHRAVPSQDLSVCHYITPRDTDLSALNCNHRRLFHTSNPANVVISLRPGERESGTHGNTPFANKGTQRERVTINHH